MSTAAGSKAYAPNYVFERVRRVEFAETDMAGIVHFTNILRYMEETEYAFLRSKGLCVSMKDERGRYGFPRLSVQCEYLLSCRFEDELTTRLAVIENTGKNLTYQFEIFRTNVNGKVNAEEKIAKGIFRVACCRFPGDANPYPIPIPDEVLEQIPLG